MDRVFQHIPDGQTVLLHRLWVHPDHRKQGIARKVWEFFLATVNTMIPKPKRIRLACEDHLIKLFLKLGFSLLGPTGVYDGVIDEQHYEMEHALA